MLIIIILSVIIGFFYIIAVEIYLRDKYEDTYYQWKEDVDT